MMDDSNELEFMLDKAIESEPLAFMSFDRTKNVQDQLQEMIMGEFPMLNWAKQFVHWLNNCDDRTYPSNRFQDGLESPWEIFHSMEQLWLAFVMKTRFEKQWLEGKWVEIAVQQEARYAIR